MQIINLNPGYMLKAEPGYTLSDGTTQSPIVVIPQDYLINKYKEIVHIETVEEVIEEHSSILNSYKESKIEEIRNKCNEAINNGFYSYCYKGIKKLYACEKEDQINIQSLHQMAISKEAIDTKISMGISLTLTEKSIKSEILRYKAKGETCYNDFTVDEVKTLMYDMNQHVTSNLNRFNELRTQILKAENESDIYYIEF